MTRPRGKTRDLLDTLALYEYQQRLRLLWRLWHLLSIHRGRLAHENLRQVLEESKKIQAYLEADYYWRWKDD
jgi:hypothetical protein